MFDAALPLRLQLFTHRVAILTSEPQAVPWQAQVEYAVAIAECATAQDRGAQRPPVGQVEMQPDPTLQRRMPGHRAGCFERRHVGHGRGRADDPGLKRGEDRRVFVRAQPEIVSVDYDLARHDRPPW